MAKKCLLLSLITLGITLAIYSRDLEQYNPETVFLSSEAIQKYEQFKKVIPEKKSIIIKYDFPKQLTTKAYEKWRHDLDKILETHEEHFNFLLPMDLFTSKNKLSQAIASGQFKKSGPNLISASHLAIIAVEKNDQSNFKEIINELLDSSHQKISIAGIPYTNYLLDLYSKSIKENVFPLMFFISFIFIYLITRELVASVFLFIPCLFSSIISLSFIKFYYGTMNMVTSIIPLLSFTIVLALVFHIYFTMIQTRSFSSALKKKIVPTCLMIVTTCIGFGSLLFSDIKAISDFGLLSASLILITSLFSLLFLNSCESFLIKNTPRKKYFEKLKDFFHKSLSIKQIVILSLVSLSVGGYALTKISIITDATRYFPHNSGLKESIDSINQDVSGMPLYEIIFKTPIIDFSELKKIEKLESELHLYLKPIDGYQGILSLVSMIRTANYIYAEEERLPDNEFAFQALRSQIKPSIAEAFPLSDYYKISILGKAINVNLYEKNLEHIKEFLERKKIDYEINGLYYNLMTSQKTMIKVLFKSFFIALIIVSLIAFLYLKKLKIFFVFIFINIVPVFLSFIFLKLLSFSINIATVMTYSIALGMIVDSSFHLIHSFKQNKLMSFDDYFNSTVLPIVGSSFLLVFSFSLFGFNDFLPIKEFGLSLSIVLSLGLFFDLFVLPSLFFKSGNIKGVFDDSL